MKNKIIEFVKYGIVFVGVFIAQTIMNKLLTSTFEENEAAGFGIGFGLIFGTLLITFLLLVYFLKEILSNSYKASIELEFINIHAANISRKLTSIMNSLQKEKDE